MTANAFPPPKMGEPYLLTPGPLTTAYEVKQAMLKDWGSWDDDFRAMTRDMRRRLLALLGEGSEHYDCVPMQGSGSFCVEAMLGSFVPRDGKVLVLANGAYGLRAATTMDYLGRAKVLLDKGDYLPPRGDEVARILAEDPAITHHERITTEVLAPYLNDDVALVTLEVIQYRSGARTDLKSITDQVRAIGALVVWDASHAVGAIELNLDANGVDLCVGCTYKYGNSGPGSPAWLYVSKRVQSELQVPIQGWFAQDAQFEMGPVFERSQTIRGFQIASPSLMGIRCVQTAFSMIKEAGIDAIAHKAAVGTQMMIELYDAWLAPLGIELNTSRNAKERGGHISLVHPDAAQICVAMRTISNVIPDYRTPNSIRLAISPLPTSYVEIWDGFERMRDLVASGRYKEAVEGGSRVT